MLDWLHIRQFVIAEDIALEFGGAFTAVTGETGSGKSLLVGAVGILLGDRVDDSLIRSGCDEAEVQGGFAAAPSHPAARWLRENGFGDDEDGDQANIDDAVDQTAAATAATECLLRRVIRRAKPSRAYINGRAVTAAQLRELGRELVDIHGQNEHHSLLRRQGQLALLDSAAGNADRLAKLGAIYQRLSALRTRMEAVKNTGQLARERADLLTFQSEELDALAPQPDDWRELEAQQKRMHHAHDLATAARSVAARLREDEAGNLCATLAECERQLQRLTQYDSRLTGILQLLGEAAVNLDEAAEQLRATYADSAPSADEIAQVEARFSLYHDLARKHRVLPGLLADKLAELRAELAALRDPEAELQRLTAEADAQHAAYAAAADAVSRARQRAAAELAAGVTALLPELGMAGGAFEIRLTDLAAGEISPRGNERAEFVVSANPGLPLQPLGKVASGGELSRISLAINVVLAADAAAATLIFDEVDVGIGGKVAAIVGQKLRQLGKARQVICITHLSQVAARSHHHWSVAKQTGEHASVSVQALDHRQRVAEIARMTAGTELTPQSLAHAERMLESP